MHPPYLFTFYDYVVRETPYEVKSLTYKKTKVLLIADRWLRRPPNCSRLAMNLIHLGFLSSQGSELHCIHLSSPISVCLLGSA